MLLEVVARGVDELVGPVGEARPRHRDGRAHERVVVRRVVVGHEPRVEGLARPLHRDHFAREGLGRARPAGGQEGGVAVAHHREHALHDVVEGVGQAPGQAGGVLHAAAQALACPHHVLVEVDEHPPRLLGVLPEVLGLARELVHPPEPDVAPRPRDPLLLHEPREGAADLQEVRAAAAVVVGRRHLLLDVRGEDDLLVVVFRPADPTLDHRLLGDGGVRGLDVDLDLERLLARGEPLQPAAAARRDHDREGGGRAVLHPRDVLRFEGQAAPGHLVRGVDDVRPVRGLREDAQGAALPDRLAVHGAHGAGGEDDLPRHVPAAVVVVARPRAHVHEAGRDVGRAAVVRDGDGDLAVRRELHLLRGDEPRLARRAGPAVPVPSLPDEPHVLEAGRGGGVPDRLRGGEEVAAARRAVERGEPPVVLERAIARDLVHELPEERLGDEGRRLRAGGAGGGGREGDREGEERGEGSLHRHGLRSDGGVYEDRATRASTTAGGPWPRPSRCRGSRWP